MDDITKLTGWAFCGNCDTYVGHELTGEVLPCPVHMAEDCLIWIAKPKQFCSTCGNEFIYMHQPTLEQLMLELPQVLELGNMYDEMAGSYE